MEALLDYLDKKISQYEKEEDAFSLAIFCELMSIKRNYSVAGEDGSFSRVSVIVLHGTPNPAIILPLSPPAC